MEILKKYRKAIKEEIEPRQAGIAKGNCETFEEYKKLAGEIRGLELSLMVLDDIETKYLREEDEL